MGWHERDKASRREPPQRRVVEERQAKQHGLKIEPIVIAGKENAGLQHDDAERGDES